MTTKINALGIGTTITVDDTPVTIIDRAPGGPGLMWATDNRGGVLQLSLIHISEPTRPY